MKIIRYQDSAGTIGFASQQPDGSAHQITGDIYGDFASSGAKAEVKKVLAPVVPSAIMGIGLNYRQHAMEVGVGIPANPVLFFKNVASVQDPDSPILLPSQRLKSSEVDYECELAVVIGKRCKNVSRAEALNYVLGYTCANDVSARDWQMKWGGGQWCRGKTFDTFAPLGPCLVTPDEIPNPGELGIRTILNGVTLQDSNTSDMIFDVPALIEFLSSSSTLMPGTVILTGTPHGVGFTRKPPVFLKPGDRVTIEIDRIGALTNPVESEQA
jgi:2-keto-4-pentenoate hydratase/2-oxohepta-3-ene-1,7-dioic acid hydratase in catechol pathway